MGLFGHNRMSLLRIERVADEPKEYFAVGSLILVTWMNLCL
jgi:hypothetical protein